MSYNIRLLIDCPDHRGLIPAVSGFIALHNGNILLADEHVSDAPSGTFFNEDGDRGPWLRPEPGRVRCRLRPAGPSARDEMAGRLHRPTQAHGRHGLEAGALPDRHALAMGGGRSWTPRSHW